MNIVDRKDDVLVAEKEAKDRIVLVNQEKEDLWRQAKDKAKKELKSHDDAIREKNQQKITELYLDRKEIESIDNKTKVDLKVIDQAYDINQNKVVDFLFESVTKVNIHIPDVVIGNFEETYK